MSEELEKLLNQWPQWSIDMRPRIKKTFSAGLNHTTALLETPSAKYVIKRFATSESGNEVMAQRWAAEQGIAPRVLYFSEDDSYCVMDVAGEESLAARVQLNASLRNSIPDSYLPQLAGALRKLHSVSLETEPKLTRLVSRLGQFNILSWCDVYLPNAGQYAQTLHSQLLPLMHSFMEDQTTLCLCHNDLVAANCFANDSSALFIDWEFAQLHNPWFDLAAIIYYLRLNERQSECFIGHYDEEWLHKIITDIYWTSQLALLWGDILWHLNKFGESFWQPLEQKRQDLSSIASKLGVHLRHPI